MDTVAAPAPIASPPPSQEALEPHNGAYGDETLTKLHPNYKIALRISVVLTAMPIIIGVSVAETVLAGAGKGSWPVPFGLMIGIVVFLALAVIIRLPGRRWQARGYTMSADRLRVVRGVLWRSDTVVPFGRVQHIDVDQGPLERALDIATLTLHTAGNHNASVKLPGLHHELARDMREEIRQRIKRESP